MALKPKQMKAAELLALFPEMKEKDIAAEVNIAPKTLWMWKTKFPEFQEYYHSICQNRFRELESLAISKLEENVVKGNQKAIEYALDYLGYHATQKVEADLHTDISITIGE